MIVRETEDVFVLVRQHDHAQLAGDVARRFQPYFRDDPHFEELVYAVYQHDWGWIRMDDTPVWNDAISAPFSFTDYPLLPKLTHYRLGLDQVEAIHPYAALLCSLHYASFNSVLTDTIEDCAAFVRYEEQRQARIRSELQIADDDLVLKHLKLLQLCDRISLYVCLNRPGASKEEEMSWYRDGFADSELFHADGDGLLIAEWLDDKHVRIAPSPFEVDFQTLLLQKHIPKRLAKELGIAAAYRQTEWFKQELVFTGRS